MFGITRNRASRGTIQPLTGAVYVYRFTVKDFWNADDAAGSETCLEKTRTAA